MVTALSHSVTCAILAPAGPARSRLLAILYKDERSQHLGHKYSVLKNMFVNRDWIFCESPFPLLFQVCCNFRSQGYFYLFFICFLGS